MQVIVMAHVGVANGVVIDLTAMHSLAPKQAH